MSLTQELSLAPTLPYAQTILHGAHNGSVSKSQRSTILHTITASILPTRISPLFCPHVIDVIFALPPSLGFTSSMYWSSSVQLRLMWIDTMPFLSGSLEIISHLWFMSKASKPALSFLKSASLMLRSPDAVEGTSMVCVICFGKCISCEYSNVGYLWLG